MSNKDLVKDMIAFLQARDGMNYDELMELFACNYGMSKKEARDMILELTKNSILWQDYIKLQTRVVAPALRCNPKMEKHLH